MQRRVGVLALAAAAAVPCEVAAQASHGCFAGRDASGLPARMELRAERYGDYFEVFGRVSTSGFGVLTIKADGWSGAGRMFRNHEGEAGALYIHISDYTGSSLVLHVDGYGSFPLRAVPC